MKLTDIKIAKTNQLGFDCIILLSEDLLEKPIKLDLYSKIKDKFGDLVVYNMNNKKGTAFLWTTNQYGVEKDAHDKVKELDFECIVFKSLDDILN